MNRQISNKRARKLRKRGEDVKYSPEHDSYVWTMRFKYFNRWKDDTTKVSIHSGK